MEYSLHFLRAMNAASDGSSPVQLRLSELLEHAHEAFDVRGRPWRSGDRSSLHDINNLAAAYLEVGRIRLPEPEEEDILLPTSVTPTLLPAVESSKELRGLKMAVAALVAVAVLGSAAVATAAYVRFRAAAPRTSPVAVATPAQPAPAALSLDAPRPETGIAAPRPAPAAPVPAVTTPVPAIPESPPPAPAPERAAVVAVAEPADAEVTAPVDAEVTAPAATEEVAEIEPVAAEEVAAIEPTEAAEPAGSVSVEAELTADPCGDVACMLEPDKACCRPQVAAAEETSVELPQRPHRAEVDSQLRRTTGPVETCADRHGVEGTVVVRLVVDPDGSVGSARPDVGPAAFGDCVQAAIRKTRYSASREGVTVSYPFIIR